ncbi:MAG: hypothetical protein KA340_13965 [Saprospiraceae bacterium]|jgi:hypothetical protein|nr:hypothetical protein [Saprospiraceae bacterium]
MKKNTLLLLALCFCAAKILSQNLLLDRAQHTDLAERLQVMYPSDKASSSALKMSSATSVIDQGFENYRALSKGDQYKFKDLVNQYNFPKEITDPLDTLYRWQKPLLKYFYESPHHFLSIDVPSFNLRANPIVLVEGGNVTNYEATIFQNTRGAEVYGYIDNKVYFFSRVLENQQQFLPWFRNYITNYNTIPQQGFYKSYNSSVLGGLHGYDFLNAQAYVGVPISKSISVELGHGRHFIGNGIRSLLLSDFSNNYFYLKFNTRVWKLHYQNIFAELNTVSANQLPDDLLLNKKYMASHYLSFRPRKNFEVGVFESVIFARQNQFEFQYLNPVIFYRMVEQFLGSPDNAMIGLNLTWDVKKRMRVYGQLLLDELNFGFLKQDGWWGNKHGVQAGLKYFNALGVDRLDLTAEYNMVRPYTYSHDRAELGIVLTSYTHYNSPLAHPLGSNLREVLVRSVYSGLKNWHFEADLAYIQQGRNYNGNEGSDPRINNLYRIRDYDNNLLQGAKQNIQFIRATTYYKIWPNYQLFLQGIYRQSTGYYKLGTVKESYFYIGGGISINAATDKNIF